jgi:hypothetical protein
VGPSPVLGQDKQGKERAGSVPHQQGKIGRVIRDARHDAELMALVRRYVTPERRYLKLGGSLLRMQSPVRPIHARSL